MNDTEAPTAAKKPRRRKAIDRGWNADLGDANEVMRDRGYRAPVKPEKVADLTDGAILQCILLSIRNHGAAPPEAYASFFYKFTPTADCAGQISFVAALHRNDPAWNAELAFALIGEAAWWAVREDARAAGRANGGSGLNAEHEAINAAVRAAIEPHLPIFLKGV